MNLLPNFLDYLLLEKNYSDNTVTAYKKDISDFFTFLKQTFDVEKEEEVDYNMVRNWIVDLSGQGKSNSTINRKMVALKSFFKFLQKTDVVKTNPLSRHKALKTPKKVLIPFNENEILAASEQNFIPDDFESLRNKLMIELLYTTGMRRAELIGLKSLNVDVNGLEIKVLGKRNKERIVPLVESVIDLIEEYLNKKNEILGITEFFFVTVKGNKMYPTLVYRIINSYFSEVSSKVKKSPHVLRHSYATDLVNNGADLNSVKELLGHTSLAATQVYTHNSLEKLKQVYNKTHPRSVDKNK